MNHVIVDGFNIAFRSHFAFRELATSSGILSGCFYGFLTSIRSLKSKFPGCHITLAWDTEAKRKKEAFVEYKATRPRFALGDPITDLKTAFSAMNVSQSEFWGEEADDVMATLAKKYSKEGTVYIYSSDKDLLQLVEDGKVIGVRPRSAKDGGMQHYDEEAVLNEFGVHPANLSCYLTFKGDVADNIPGAPRVPKKIISSLSERFGDPWTVYKNLTDETLTKFQRETLEKFEQQAYVNWGLIKLVDDLDLTISEGTPDPEVFKMYLKKYEVKSVSADRYTEIFSKESSFSEKKAPSIENYSLF